MWWFGKRQNRWEQQEVEDISIYGGEYDDQDDDEDELDGLSMSYCRHQDWNLVQHSKVAEEMERVKLVCFPEELRMEALDNLQHALKYQLDHAPHHPGHDAELMHGNIASVLYCKLAVCLATSPCDRELFLLGRCIHLVHQRASDHVVERVYNREILPLVVKVLLLPFLSSRRNAVDSIGGHRHTTLPDEGWYPSNSSEDYYTRIRYLESSGQRSSDALKHGIQDLCHVMSQYAMVSEYAKKDMVHHPDMLFALLCILDDTHGMTMEARQAVLATLNYVSETPDDSVRALLKRDFLPLLRKICRDEKSLLSPAAKRQAQMTLSNLTGGAYIQMSHLRSNSCQSLDLLQLSADGDGDGGHPQKPPKNAVWGDQPQSRPATPVGVNQFRPMSRRSSSNSLQKLGLGFTKSSENATTGRGENYHDHHHLHQQEHPFFKKDPEPNPFFGGFETAPQTSPTDLIVIPAGPNNFYLPKKTHD